MPIVNEADWNTWVDANNDPYGKCCVDVARECMRLLDTMPDAAPVNADELVRQAAKSIGAGGITGFMAGCVAQMVSHCHSRGEKFRRAWNVETQIGTEGDRANAAGTVLNPAILVIGEEKEP